MSLLLEQTSGQPIFHSVRTLLQKAASTSDNVLITGQKTTEKENLARAIHRNGKRSSGPFIIVSTKNIPLKDLKQRLMAPGGLLEKADGGTLYFEELGSLSPHTQEELLAVLKGRRMPVWHEGKFRSLDVRIIASTRMDLRDEKLGFNPGLYQKIAELPILLQSENPYFFIPQSTSLPTLEEVEQQYIQYVMRMARGNKAKASRILGINRRTLYRKVPELQLIG